MSAAREIGAGRGAGPPDIPEDCRAPARADNRSGTVSGCARPLRRQTCHKPTYRTPGMIAGPRPLPSSIRSLRRDAMQSPQKVGDAVEEGPSSQGGRTLDGIRQHSVAHGSRFRRLSGRRLRTAKASTRCRNGWGPQPSRRFDSSSGRAVRRSRLLTEFGPDFGATIGHTTLCGDPPPAR